MRVKLAIIASEVLLQTGCRHKLRMPDVSIYNFIGRRIIKIYKNPERVHTTSSNSMGSYCIQFLHPTHCQALRIHMGQDSIRLRDESYDFQVLTSLKSITTICTRTVTTTAATTRDQTSNGKQLCKIQEANRHTKMDVRIIVHLKVLNAYLKR